MAGGCVMRRRRVMSRSSVMGRGRSGVGRGGGRMMGRDRGGRRLTVDVHVDVPVASDLEADVVPGRNVDRRGDAVVGHRHDDVIARRGVR